MKQDAACFIRFSNLSNRARHRDFLNRYNRWLKNDKIKHNGNKISDRYLNVPRINYKSKYL